MEKKSYQQLAANDDANFGDSKSELLAQHFAGQDIFGDNKPSGVRPEAPKTANTNLAPPKVQQSISLNTGQENKNKSEGQATVEDVKSFFQNKLVISFFAGLLVIVVLILLNPPFLQKTIKKSANKIASNKIIPSGGVDIYNVLLLGLITSAVTFAVPNVIDFVKEAQENYKKR